MNEMRYQSPENTTDLTKKKSKKKQKQAIMLTEKEASYYLTQSRKSHRMVGLGVWLIMTGVSCVTLFGGFGVMALFVGIAFAVMMFIMAGHHDTSYEGIEDKPIRLDAHTYQLIESKWQGIQRRSHLSIAAGVALILLAVGGVAGVGMHPAGLLFTIGFSVYLFITSGGSSDTVDHLLSKGDYAKYGEHLPIGQYVDSDACIPAIQPPVVEEKAPADLIKKHLDVDQSMLMQEMNELLNRGNQFISEVTIAKRYIDHAQTLQQIDRILDTTNKIMLRIEKEPSLTHNIQRFFDYYLTTTSKLVVSYSDVKRHGVTGVNIDATLKKIEDALVNLSDAFQAQLERLYEHTTMDLDTDITTLEMMLNKDGLLNMDQIMK